MISRLKVLTLVLLAISTSVQAGAIAGHDYAVLDVPQRQEVNGRIEVIEFFSWGCPHCYDFHPLLGRWTATLPKDAAFRRVPVSLGHPEWEALVRAYYSLQITGDLARLDSLIFEAVNYRVSGIPTLAIGGRYTVTGDQPKMLTTSTELIVKARALDKEAGK